MIRPMGVPVLSLVTPERERTVSRAVTLAASYLTNPDRNRLTEQARTLANEDMRRTATDIAYLIVRSGQGELGL